MFPYTYEELDDDTNEQVKRDFLAYKTGLIRCKPSNLIMPRDYMELGEKIYSMEVRDEDVWVVTYPKSGTTWTQAIVWAVINEGKFENLKESLHHSVWKFIEASCLMTNTVTHMEELGIISREQKDVMNSNFGREFERAVESPSPRYIKTHLPLCHLPPDLLNKAKVVYVARNAKDMMVSFYYHNTDFLFADFRKSFPEYFEYCMKDLVIWDPYWPHVLEAYQKRQHPNLLFLFFEEIIKDFPGTIKKIAKFLGKSLTKEQIEKIAFELSIENMRKNNLLNFGAVKDAKIAKRRGRFLRKGIIGDWKTHFTPDMLKEYKEWEEKRKAGYDISFIDE